jgi:hypothetical protein
VNNKPNKLEQDIVSLLQKHQPEFLRWCEIIDSLWQMPAYKNRYKNRTVFGASVSRRLALLEAAGKLDHMENCYRTPQSRKAEADNIRKAVEEMRKEFYYLKDPTLTEVACKVGKPPATVEPLLYAQAQQTGWTPPDETTQTEAQDAINLAGWLNAEKNNQITPERKPRCEQAKARASKRTRQIAQNLLECFPNLIPKIFIDDRLMWPEETAAAWYRTFKTESPGPRQSPSGVSIAFTHPKLSEELRPPWNNPFSE